MIMIFYHFIIITNIILKLAQLEFALNASAIGNDFGRGDSCIDFLCNCDAMM